MENRKPDTISYFDHEEQMAREERHTNRWKIAAIVLFFSLLASLVYIVYIETQYEDFVTETKEVVTSKIEPTIGDYGDSEFLQAVKGKKADVIWEIMDELVDTVQLINPKLYDGLMRQLM